MAVQVARELREDAMRLYPEVYNYTQYPELFMNTYWGNFRVDPHRAGAEVFIPNRNEFIKEFNITGVAELPYKLFKEFIKPLKERYTACFDHTECYYSHYNKKYIFVSSPYLEAHHKDFAYKYNIYKNHGFREYKKLYAKNAITFIKEICI